VNQEHRAGSRESHINLPYAVCVVFVFLLPGLIMLYLCIATIRIIIIKIIIIIIITPSKERVSHSFKLDLHHTVPVPSPQSPVPVPTQDQFLHSICNLTFLLLALPLPPVLDSSVLFCTVLYCTSTVILVLVVRLPILLPEPTG
jgi:hypothetical protein